MYMCDGPIASSHDGVLHSVLASVCGIDVHVSK